MRTTINFMLAAVAAMAMAFTVKAQPPQGRPERSPEERAKFMVERMAERLGLTEKQQQQILDLHKEMAAEREDNAETPETKKRPSKEEREKRLEEMKTRMEARHAEYDKSMKEILNEEQYAAWKEQQERMRQRGPEGRGNDRRNAPRGNRSEPTHPEN